MYIQHLRTLHGDGSTGMEAWGWKHGDGSTTAMQICTRLDGWKRARLVREREKEN